MGGAICSVAAGHGRNWGAGAVTGCYGPLLLGTRDAFGEVRPALRFADTSGAPRLPEQILSLVRPRVGTADGDVLLYNGGKDECQLGWCQDGGELLPVSVAAGDTLHLPFR
jgi:hypothetical protein